MVMTSGRSGKRQPKIIDDAASKTRRVNTTLFITEPVQVRARFVALRVSWQPDLMKRFAQRSRHDVAFVRERRQVEKTRPRNKRLITSVVFLVAGEK